MLQPIDSKISYLWRVSHSYLRSLAIVQEVCWTHTLNMSCILHFIKRSWGHPSFPKHFCYKWHGNLNQLALSQHIPKIAHDFAKYMNDGAILRFGKSFYDKTSACFALINESVLPAGPQGRLLLRHDQKSQEYLEGDVHTTGGSFCLFWLGTSLQVHRQLRCSHPFHGMQTVLPILQIK